MSTQHSFLSSNSSFQSEQANTVVKTSLQDTKIVYEDNLNDDDDDENTTTFPV